MFKVWGLVSLQRERQGIGLVIIEASMLGIWKASFRGSRIPRLAVSSKTQRWGSEMSG